MKSRLTAVVLCASLLVLTACGSGSADADIDKNTATAHCGLLGGLLTGDVPITAENYEEVQETLATLAEDGVGAVKPTAQHLIKQIDGEEFSKAEDERVIEDFKDFCMDYTVD